MNNNDGVKILVEETGGARFSPKLIVDTNTSGITERREFRGDPKLYAKQLTLIGVFVVIGIALLGYFGLGERNPNFYMFMCGMAVVILFGRYFSMMGLKGPPSLAFHLNGITLQRGKKTTEIRWADLRGIRNEVIRGGQLWEFVWAGGKFDYFIDGLTGAQKEELKKTIGNIKLPHVKIRLEHYDRNV